MRDEHHQPDVEPLAAVQRRSAADVAFQRSDLARQPRDEEQRANTDQQPRDRDQRRVVHPGERLPHLRRQEQHDREQHQQRDRAREQDHARRELAAEPPRRPRHDRQQAVADRPVEHREHGDVRHRGDPGAAGLAAEDRRQHGRQQDEAREFQRADVARPRQQRPAAQAVRQREPTEQDRHAADQRADVGPRRPLQIDRAEDLADEHQAQDRDRARPDLRPRRRPGDEQRQTGAPEARLVLGEPGIHDAQHSWRAGHRLRLDADTGGA